VSNVSANVITIPQALIHHYTQAKATCRQTTEDHWWIVVKGDIFEGDDAWFKCSLNGTWLCFKLRAFCYKMLFHSFGGEIASNFSHETLLIIVRNTNVSWNTVWETWFRLLCARKYTDHFCVVGYPVWPGTADFVGGHSWMFTSYRGCRGEQKRQGRCCMCSAVKLYSLRHRHSSVGWGVATADYLQNCFCTPDCLL
jgi:hypothetical protein